MTRSTPTRPVPETRGTSYSRDRVLTLSDGVFAIAITLLVLDLVPNIPTGVTGPRFVSELFDMAPELVAYFLSFLVIGRFWDSHRSFFRYISLADARVSWINLLLLLWITLIPATAALLGSHWQEPAAIILYTINVVLATASLWLLWRYASSVSYLEEQALPASTKQYFNRFVGASLAGYALAIPAAFLSPPVGLALVFLTATLARRLAGHVLTPRPTGEIGSVSGPQGRGSNSADEEE